jgi:hypothetical protein
MLKPMILPKIGYRHMDVFSSEPLSGNGLNVFETTEELPTDLMQALTREMRQFESIFLVRTADPSVYRASWTIQLHSKRVPLVSGEVCMVGAGSLGI